MSLLIHLLDNNPFNTPYLSFVFCLIISHTSCLTLYIYYIYIYIGAPHPRSSRTNKDISMATLSSSSRRSPQTSGRTPVSTLGRTPTPGRLRKTSSEGGGGSASKTLFAGSLDLPNISSPSLDTMDVKKTPRSAVERETRPRRNSGSNLLKRLSAPLSDFASLFTNAKTVVLEDPAALSSSPVLPPPAALASRGPKVSLELKKVAMAKHEGAGGMSHSSTASTPSTPHLSHLSHRASTPGPGSVVKTLKSPLSRPSTTQRGLARRREANLAFINKKVFIYGLLRLLGLLY